GPCRCCGPSAPKCRAASTATSLCSRGRRRGDMLSGRCIPGGILVRGIEQIPLLYDAVMAVTDRIGLWKLRAWLTRGASGRALEAGCGTGHNLPRYPPSARVMGNETWLDSLRAAERRAPSVRLFCERRE